MGNEKGIERMGKIKEMGKQKGNRMDGETKRELKGWEKNKGNGKDGKSKGNGMNGETQREWMVDRWKCDEMRYITYRQEMVHTKMSWKGEFNF